MVLPNWVRPIAGLAPDSPSTARPWAIMPASAWAALARTRSEIRLMPATSVTEYIMQMSDGPT